MGIPKNKITKILTLITINCIILLSVYQPVVSLDNTILTESNEVESLIEMNYFNNDYMEDMAEQSFSVINFYDENDNMIFSNDDTSIPSEYNYKPNTIERSTFDELPEFEVSIKSIRVRGAS